MVTRKSQSETLKGKIEKYQKELKKIQDEAKSNENKIQKKTDDYVAKIEEITMKKEKDISKNLNTVQADYIVALMTESGKSIEELEIFAKETNIVSKTGGDSNVQGY